MINYKKKLYIPNEYNASLDSIKLLLILSKLQYLLTIKGNDKEHYNCLKNVKPLYIHFAT